MITIVFPLTQKQAVAIVVVADRFGVEPWEMAQHVLNVRTQLSSPLPPLRARRKEAPS